MTTFWCDNNVQLAVFLMVPCNAESHMPAVYLFGLCITFFGFAVNGGERIATASTENQVIQLLQAKELCSVQKASSG